MKTFKDLLIELDACESAIDWAEDKPIDKIVETCHRGDWLLWLAHQVNIGLKPLTLTKGHCANTVRHLMDDERSIIAVDTAIAFGESKATIDELNAAADAAASAASAADYAASWAANATASAAAAEAAADAAASWAADAVCIWYKNQMETADICRKYIGDLIIEKVNEQLKTTEQ